MKTPISLFLVSIVLASTAIIGLSDADFYTTTTNLWNQGHKHEVYTNAQERLNVYTNDMAGLLLSLVYDIEFLQLDTISNSAMRVREQGALITNEHFRAEYPDLEENIDVLLTLLAEQPMTEEECVQDAAKGNIPGKRMLFSGALEALQMDNLIPELQ